METRILFAPQKPCYHKIDPIVSYLSLDKVDTNPDIVFYWNHFNDTEEVGDELFRYGVRILNGDIERTDKITVDRIFESVFGYSSLVTEGECVKKSIFQARKGAVIIDQPDFKENFIYQKVLGEYTADGLVEYRVTIINRKISVVLKRIKVELFKTSPDEIVTVFNPFSNNEIELINKFADIFGLDFGDLDILIEGDKIYIIDVNNTPSYRILEKVPKNVVEIMSNDFKKMINE